MATLTSDPEQLQKNRSKNDNTRPGLISSAFLCAFASKIVLRDIFINKWQESLFS
jgi:hypothetical protein